jgi:hypothetical protein
MHATILRQIESAGYATSVHRMGQRCELHAVRKRDVGEVHIARAEGDGDEQVYLAACELARMVGVDMEG